MSGHPRPQLVREDDVTIVVFNSELKTISEDYMPEIGEVMLQAGDQDPPLVVLDMDGVQFFSSSFIELMFRLWNRLNKRQGRFALCNLFPYCREVLKITNLLSIWKICDTREDAIAWLKQPEQAS